MTALGPSRRRPAARRRGRRRLVAGAVLVLAGGALFILGIGLGQALEEGPQPGGTRTQVRTLRPLPLAPERETVTVEVTVTGEAP